MPIFNALDEATKALVRDMFLADEVLYVNSGNMTMDDIGFLLLGLVDYPVLSSVLSVNTYKTVDPTNKAVISTYPNGGPISVA